ncbi:DUF2267 domain-containing protein [Inquilinus limosus]|uniref:DUF2267 domain-containing protein n=1 Tax=Inquilinus limosus MP06 TaxID=1398085 RepID=A0A0A0D416_9PROT|nr:DUF2267 domain-containing protein [Inquilinus limosus]KGM32563.1 hypothetical protein P409_20675 [Inquilinus limosus MP06]
MSATGLEVFDKTLQTTNIWLNEIGEALGTDRQRCYHALRAVLQTLRDRLSVESAAHVSAQLPMLVRGIFYDGYHPAGTPEVVRSRDEFLQRISARLDSDRAIDAGDAARAVFAVMTHHLPEGTVRHMTDTLPDQIGQLFPPPSVH